MTIRTERAKRPRRARGPVVARRAAPDSSPLTAHSLLRLMWLASPTLPVGGFSYSEGLEAAFESSRISNEAETLRWLQDQLHLSLARSDLAVASKAFRAWERRDAARLTALNAWVLQTRESSESRLLAFAFGWAENMVQAALKAARLGQNAGQRILAQLTRELPVAVDEAIGLSDHERQAFTPMLAILSAQHETQYSRLFRS